MQQANLQGVKFGRRSGGRLRAGKSRSDVLTNIPRLPRWAAPSRGVWILTDRTLAMAGDRTSGRRHGGYQAPIFAWVPSVAVSSLLQVQRFDRRWDGDLLVASLKAQSLFRLRLHRGSVLYSEPIWIGQRIRDIAQLQDGTIVLWTDDTELQFMSVDRQRLEQNKRTPMSASDTLVAGLHVLPPFWADQRDGLCPVADQRAGGKIGFR